MRTLITTTLLALLFVVPALAQDSTKERGTDAPKIEGRNDFLKRGFEKVAKTTSRHVVKLSSLKGTHLGYGVVIDNGYVLTSKDILPKNGASVRAATISGDSLTATIVGGNDENGISLLRLSGGNVPAITQGSDKALAIGTFVATVGTTNTPLNVGVVSAKDRVVETAAGQKNILMGLFSDGNEGPQRPYPSVLHYDGPLLTEHFGAPLVDTQGRLVGINVSAPYRGSSHAVGIDQIRKFIGTLKNAPKRPFVGMSAAESTIKLPREGEGFALEVREVQAGGPAAKAGIKKGDVITHVAGRRVESLNGFGQQIMDRRPGEGLNLKIIRGGAVELSITLTLGAR